MHKVWLYLLDYTRRFGSFLYSRLQVVGDMLIGVKFSIQDVLASIPAVASLVEWSS